MVVSRGLAVMALLGVLFVSEARAELSVGDAVPDCELINEEGKPFHLHELKGQALAITFIFTRCPLANYCPLMTSHFLTVQRELGKDSPTLLGKDSPTLKWHLLSLSFDPEHDTPNQLQRYRQAHGVNAERWTFATGKPGAIAAFGAHFGLTVSFTEGFLNHNLRTVVIDTAGRVQHIFKGNEWKPEELLWEMRKAMAE